MSPEGVNLMTGKEKKIFEELRIPLAGEEQTIDAKRYGHGENIVVLSNMDTNDPEEWQSLIEAADTESYALVTYTYPAGDANHARALGAVLDFIEDEKRTPPADRVILLGASRGGVVSLQVAARRGDERIVAVVALSAPSEHEGIKFFTDADLRMITVPKLLLNSEFDDWIEDTRNVFATVEDPRHLTVYPGDAHGTELFREHGESLSQQLTEYFEWAFRR